MSDFKQKCEKFSEILNKYNKIHSLTNYKNFDEQINDSIAILDMVKISANKAVDIGSGAGFPAIFLAMKLNECEWHLYEPNHKKSAFLTLAKIELDLKNVIIHSAKLQDGDKFIADLITSRALMKVADLVKISRGFFNENTKFLLYKGSSVTDELNGFSAKVFNKNNRNYILMDKVCWGKF